MKQRQQTDRTQPTERAVRGQANPVVLRIVTEVGESQRARILQAAGARVTQWYREHRNREDVWEAFHVVLGEWWPHCFMVAWNIFVERCLLEPETSQWCKAGALDIWVFVSRWWQSCAPTGHAMVPYLLYEFMKAQGFALPAKYSTAKRRRRLIMQKVREATDPCSEMSAEKRRRWEGTYPSTVESLAEIPFASPVSKTAILRKTKIAY